MLSRFMVCAVFLSLTPAIQAQRKLQPGQSSRLTTIGIDGSDPKVVYETETQIEAPNWTSDGKWLVYNSGGLWRIPADGSGKPEAVDIGGLTNVNNDHVLSPDGKTIYFGTAGHIFAVPFAGGKPRRVSNDPGPGKNFRYWLHGVSPDGKTLAYVGSKEVNGDAFGSLDLYTIPAAGGEDRLLDDHKAADDGPDYSPDGKWIYFNSERSDHSQIWRMKPDGTGHEQLTKDDRVNWFPHPSPDGKWVVYLSYPPGTKKHPADKDVILRRMRPDGSEQADVVAVFGGQGTMNVPSWSPDGKRFAFVAYPLKDDPKGK
jgi:Tol biopolymer transport system component